MINVEDFKKYSDILKNYLNRDYNPVAVKLFKKEENTMEYFDKTDKKIMHCQSILNASKGESFYGTKNEIGCKMGKCVLGLNSLPEEFTEGVIFDKNNTCSTLSSGRYYAEQVPKMPYEIEAIGYTPLEDAKFIPDVIVIVAKPKIIFDLIRANTYLSGERITSSVGGTQSFCGDIVVNTFLTKTPNISFGCMGSHLATDFEPTEVVMGFPSETFDNIVESVVRTNNLHKN